MTSTKSFGRLVTVAGGNTQGEWTVERIGSNVAANPLGFSYAATQCLAVGQYSRPQRFAVEAITAFIQARITDKLDACRESGMLFGVLVPLAYTLGYHRDPAHLKHVSSFEGEMRRRTWSLIVQLDLLHSFQLGLPHNIQAGTWDVKSPGNYHDADLTENMSILPPPRPPSEMTKMLFYNSKQMLASVFAKILQAVLCTSQDAQDSILVQQQQELDDAYAAIPTALHYHNISESIADPVMLFVTRRCLQLM